MKREGLADMRSRALKKAMAAAVKTATKRQRAEIRDLKARLRTAVMLADKHICRHESRHRGGVIWEICDLCGAKWADDCGGFEENADAARFDAVSDITNKNWRKP